MTALELADELQRLCCAETEGKFFDCVTDNIGTIIAALRLSASPAGNGGREEIARIIWNGFARQGGAFDHAKGTVAYEHCMGIADAILALTSAVAPDGAREITDAMLNAHLKATGNWVEPHEARREDGVAIECDLTQTDADQINAEQRDDLRTGYAAALASHPHQPVEDKR